MAELEQHYLDPAAEITEDNTYRDDETGTYQFDDAAALKLVLDDTQQADNYMNINQWASGWTLADTLYQSPLATSAFDGGNVAQANVPKFTVSNHISSIVPKLMGGLFSEDPPFLLRPMPGTSNDIVNAKTALFTQQLNDMKFEEECERALDQMALFGTCIMKWGFVNFTKKDKSYKRKASPIQIQIPGQPDGNIDTPDSDDFEVEYIEKLIARPWIKYCDIRTVLVASGCRYGDIRKSNHAIYRDYATFSDLDHLRGTEGYNIPDEDILRSYFMKVVTTPSPDNISMTIPEGMRGYLQHAIPRNFKQTADPMQNGLEILERWDNEKVIVVLCCNGHNILIRNEANPYGKIPFYSANWRNIPDCFYGQGLGQLIGSEQLVEQGVTNLALDLLAYGLQPTAIRKKGFNAPTQTIKWGQGKIIDVDEDVDKAFKFLEMPTVPSEAWNFVKQAKSDSAATSGANEQVVQGAGSMGATSTGMRSGTGAAAVVQANASRLDGPDGRFVRQVFEPWIYQMDELNNDYIPTSVLRRILGERLGQVWQGDHIEFRNAKLEYEVLAGGKLGAKKEMAQFLPIMLQLFNSPTFEQNITSSDYVFDGVAIFNEFATAAGWKFSQSFLKPMTDQQKAKRDASSPAALQAQQAKTQQGLQAQKFAQGQKMLEQEQLGKAGGEVLRLATEHALQSEEVNGTPGNSGFGSTTSL